jgi:hypothetical protein
MNDHRTGKAFPDPRTPGDPRLLDQVQRRTPMSPGEVTNVPGGTILTGPMKRRAAVSKHPFKIRVVRESSENRMFVEYGNVFITTWYPDSGSQYIPIKQLRPPLFSDGDWLENMPLDGVGTGIDGYEVLSTSTTYGVWLRLDGIPTDDSPSVQLGLSQVQIVNAMAYHCDDPEIFVSSTCPDYDDLGSLMDSTTGKAYFYIGKVIIDGDDNATIVQIVKSDVDMPAAFFPATIASLDAENLLTTGTDEGVMLDPEDVVTDITGGTDIDSTDDGGGSWTIDYTGS